MAFLPEEDLICSICQEIFQEPVVLTCSHSFCQDCLKRWWKEKPTQECPFCKRRSSKSDPPRNLSLRNLCEAYAKHKKKAPESEEHMCPLHSERLRLFCLSDQQPVCVVCRDSTAHSRHKFKPIDEATKDLKNKLEVSLDPLKAQLETMEQYKENCELSLIHIQAKAREMANLIEKEFIKLHDFLSEQQESRMKVLKVEEEEKTQSMKDKISAVNKDIEVLLETIRTTEEQLRAADISFLLNYKATTERVQRCPLQKEPQLGTGALIDQAKHVGNLSHDIWNKMKRLVQFSSVILDPNTAHPELILSTDLRSFTAGEEQKLPKIPERVRVLDYKMVRGSVGFDSGSHSWDVDVGDSDEWEIGLVTHSAYYISEDEYIPDDAGWWSLEFEDDEYCAFNIDKKKDSVIKLKYNPRRIRVHLECDKRKLTFYDADTNSRLHSFSQLYRQKLFPMFRTSKSMSILPQKI